MPGSEEAITASYLARLAEQEPGQLPFEIFVSVAKLTVMHTVEVGFVRPSYENTRSALILLTRRPAADKFWANQWHIPGSVVRVTDPIKHEHDYDAAFARVLDEVGGSIELVSKPLEYDTVRRKSLRGSEVTVRLLAEVAGDPDNGRFFDMAGILREPPEDGLVESHAAAIAKIASTYDALRSG